MNYANPLLIKIRRIGQHLGVLRPMVRLYRRIAHLNYEQGFDSYMMSNIGPGDIVWDIGANVGVFTEKFAHAIGENGKVIAFEPAPGTYNILKQNIIALNNVVAENVALSDFAGEADFGVSENDAADPTNSFVKKTSDSKTVKVIVKTGQSYCQEYPECFPTKIKVDVEGFELEVIKGFGDLLNDRRLKSVFLEMHFLALASRGLRDAPSDIVKILKGASFRVKWIDPSHLVAERL